jgi:hypothetical protein
MSEGARFVGIVELHVRYGAGRSMKAYRLAVWRDVRRGVFPAPVVLSTNKRAWRLEDLLAWEASLQPVSYAPAKAVTA